MQLQSQRFRNFYRFAPVLLASGGIAFSVCGTEAEAQTVNLQEVEVISTTPVPGATGIEVNKVPALVSTVTAKDFDEKKSPSVVDAITAHVPGAIAINVDGSDLSPDLFYRGFDVSRISGTANGLAVYQNGVRINEAFGDGVNLDLVPPIAVDHADVYTNNPIFGLNALGGAIAFTMKNGFTFHGGDTTILGGSYGRVNGNLEYGKEIDNYSFYFAGDGYRDGGYRPFGAQNAERGYLDLGYKTPDAEIHAIAGYGRSLLGVQGVTPQVLVNQQYNSVFTTPQTTNNQAGLAQITSRFEVAPHWTLSSNFYFRHFDQYHVDGNDADIESCSDKKKSPLFDTGCLPSDSAPATATAAQRQYLVNGQPFAYLGDGFPYGSTARTSTHTNSFGSQLQIANRDKIFDHDNYFVFGGSADQSYTNFSSYTTLGQLNAAFQNLEFGIPGTGGALMTAPGLGFGPVYVHTSSTYFGVFTLDTFNVTKEFAVTAGARYNVANIDLQDASGMNSALNSSNSYNRINPVVGATYEFMPEFTVYAGYSEANRAPTPLESSCSNQFNPCILETALVSDPPLKQVVSHTVEGGARGNIKLPDEYGTLTYKAGYFRTESDNDIVSEASALTGQGFYVNVPETLRQGFEGGLTYNKGPWSIYANYAFIDATYQFNALFSSPNNPSANPNTGNISVHPGNHIPGIPQNLTKIGVQYQVTPKFTVGADAIIVGSQFYVGDDNNSQPKLPLYYTINVRASYQVTDNVQVFGMINNVTDNHYATYGTFFDPTTTGGNINQTLFNNNPANGGAGNARAVTVAQPISFYGGVKVTF
jgi:iron complex outermembrane receptor protein